MHILVQFKIQNRNVIPLPTLHSHTRKCAYITISNLTLTDVFTFPLTVLHTQIRLNQKTHTP